MNKNSEQKILSQAQEKKYLTIENNDVFYHCCRKQKEDYSNPEERVRAWTYAWLTVERDYPPEKIDIEHSTPVGRADIVVFEDQACSIPYLVVENKQKDYTTEDWEDGIDKAFKHANSLRETKYALVEAQTRSVLYDIQNYPPEERENNIVGSKESLPERFGEPVEYKLIAGRKDDIRSPPMTELLNHIEKAHSAIWSGGKRDPLSALEEWSKLVFVKIWDERHTPRGEARKVQVGIKEPPGEVADKIHQTFKEATKEDPSIFGSEEIKLSPTKIQSVIRILQHDKILEMDMDSLALAFEQFLSKEFRGGLGQYFTRREIIRFIIKILDTSNEDWILDPACGTGGFLLEAIKTVWGDIEERYSGVRNIERLKTDFAQKHLYGIEINPIVSQICQTLLFVHRDGHTNIEGETTCFDIDFGHDRLDPETPQFTLVVGNPPFGDAIQEGDRDRLGSNELSNFQLANSSTLKSEIAALERAIQFLEPGGKLGFVMPDGILNNSGEQSNCPATRRFLLKKGKILAIVSLPDYAFKKAGAENKTSVLLFQKYTKEEEKRFDESFRSSLSESDETSFSELTGSEQWEVIIDALKSMRYEVFLAEADKIGFSAIWQKISQNDLYKEEDGKVIEDKGSTILGQYRVFSDHPRNYEGTEDPKCMAIDVIEMLEAHSSGRWDPKFFLFRRQQKLTKPPCDTERKRLGDLLDRKIRRVKPEEHPDREYRVPTLTKEGELKQREAGKGKNPPNWTGKYVGESSSRWSKIEEGDLLFSKIDLRRGCITVVPSDWDGAVTTSEFPTYKINTNKLNPHYLSILLRSQYFKDAIRSICTGHSNRRRTQIEDFENLEIYIHKKEEQREIANMFLEKKSQIQETQEELSELRSKFDEIIRGELSFTEFESYFAGK